MERKWPLLTEHRPPVEYDCSTITVEYDYIQNGSFSCHDDHFDAGTFKNSASHVVLLVANELTIYYLISTFDNKPAPRKAKL